MLSRTSGGWSEERVDGEVPLAGGAHSHVVRVGRTVRRRSGAWSSTVLDLLEHLHREGFRGAPRALGFDEHGREMLSFVEGEAGAALPALDAVVVPPADHWVRRDEVLIRLGRLMRAAHDAAATFPGAGRPWQQAPVSPVETICHNDLSPWNTVFRDGLPVAFIDWESASPGPRVSDLGFAAWRWVPLWPDESCRRAGLPTGMRSKARRVGVLFGAYGRAVSEADMLSTADRVQRFLDDVLVLVAEGSAWEVELAERGVLDEIAAQIRFIRDHAAELATPTGSR